MTEIAQFLPHERRFFVHKAIIGRVIKRAGRGQRRAARKRRRAAAAAAAGQAPVATAPSVRRPAPRTETARPSETSAAEKEMGRQAKFPEAARGIRSNGRGGRCPGLLQVEGPRGTCIDLAALPPGGRPAIRQVDVGDAIMGRYGAALEPGSRMIDRAVCLRGMVLGNDGLCYNKPFPNKQRMWPAGRKPLLTGGEMRCIQIAATAGRRLERTTKRLQKIGLMKKPAPRSRRITSGPTEHHHHS